MDFAKTALKNEQFKTTGVWKHLDKMNSVLFMEISPQRIIYNNEPAMLGAIAIIINFFCKHHN